MSGFAAEFGGYSDSELEAIIEAGGGLIDGQNRNELRACLHNQISIAKDLTQSKRWHFAPKATPADFAKISRAASRLLNLLGVRPGDTPPSVAPKLYEGFVQEGRKWAQQWFHAQEKEQQISLLIEARRKLSKDNQTKREKRERRHQLRERKRKGKHILHGSWPRETTNAWPNHYYGEDLALVQAIEGIRRIQTWAEGATKTSPIPRPKSSIAAVGSPGTELEFAL